MGTTTQNKQGLKHISFLRRIFLKKLSGELHLTFSTGEKNVLQFKTGDFLDPKEELIPVLRRFLTEHIPEYAWEPYIIEPNTSGWVAPWIALSKALYGLPTNGQRLALYKHAFSKLPPMVLKNCPVHRMNFADADAYLILYHLSLGVPSFDPKIFFLGNLSNEDLVKRVRTVLLVFLLGYLRAAPRKEENKNVSIVSRILKRFKAKGAA